MNDVLIKKLNDWVNIQVYIANSFTLSVYAHLNLMLIPHQTQRICLNNSLIVNPVYMYLYIY